jgi:hypothetical protein
LQDAGGVDQPIAFGHADLALERLDERPELLALQLGERVHPLGAAVVFERGEDPLVLLGIGRRHDAQRADQIAARTSCQSAMTMFAMTLLRCTAGESAVFDTFHALSIVA